jgi:hypothetical protein
MNTNILTQMVEVNLTREDSFLLIKETLTRICVASKKDNTLFQSCHILHKQGKYYITHFKHLFALDGRKSTVTDDDIIRQNTIALLLEQWNLLTVKNKNIETCDLSAIKVLSHTEKLKWELIPKYKIGSK